MACTATTRRRPRLRIDRKLGRALAQPIKTSSATCWRRASRSRMAIPVDIACALGMRVVSIQSEAGGRLGQGNRHDSLRPPRANWAPLWATSVTTSSPTRWMRATRSRMAFPMGIACALKMRVGSICSEAGGRLGRCELHESRRQAPAFSAPILARSVTTLSPTR